MGLVDFFKNKVKHSQKSPKLNYSTNGTSISIGEFTGEYHQSSKGRFILAWKSSGDNGKYILLDRGKIKLQAKMRHPDNGMVSNSGVFLLSDLTSKGMEFVAVDQKPFRAKLEAAGFYKEWKGKYGEEAWAVLEKYAGKIS